jgi:6-phosphogluconolactonase
MHEHTFTDTAELNTTLAADIATRLQSALDARGKAYLVVSGGSTPKALFAVLAATELAWDKVTVLLADERWVPDDHADCNERMVREHLLTGKAQNAQLLSLTEGYPDTAANLAIVNSALANIGAFDVVVLGMGLDGHTASLFPQAPELTEGLETDNPALMTSPQTAPHARISLSRKRILDTHYGVLHIVGEDKRAVLNDALASDDHLTYPVLNFLRGSDAFALFYAP